MNYHILIRGRKTGLKCTVKWIEKSLVKCWYSVSKTAGAVILCSVEREEKCQIRSTNKKETDYRTSSEITQASLRKFGEQVKF